MKKIQLLFLCSGSACRSQMAQGWIKALTTNKVSVKAACIEAQEMNDFAINSMAEVGIDISELEPIRINREVLEWANVVVTLCDYAKEQCPIIDPQTRTLHVPIFDPAKCCGTRQQIQLEFIEARERIKVCVQNIVDLIMLATGD